MNKDFSEMLDALSAAGVEFLVVGAHALAAHGRPRATGDLDIWVRATPANAARVWKALENFGAPLSELTETDFATSDLVFQIGLPPSRIDILTSLTGLRFDAAWENRVILDIDRRSIPFLSRTDLITNKKALGRLRDLADVEDLERER